MAKYVCEFEKVTEAGDIIIAAANIISQATTSYISNLRQDLSTWNGDGRASFANSNNAQMQAIASKITRMDEFGQFVKEVAKQIQELDDEIAAIKI